jgi:hypothetical protein
VCLLNSMHTYLTRLFSRGYAAPLSLDFRFDPITMIYLAYHLFGTAIASVKHKQSLSEQQRKIFIEQFL